MIVHSCRKHARLLGKAPRHVQKAGAPPHEWLLELADKASPKVRLAFLQALERARQAGDTAELDDAIKRGDVEAAMRALAFDEAFMEALKIAFPKPLQDTFIAAGRLTPENSTVRMGMGFDLTNPKAIEHLRTYDLGLIQQITNDTREGIRQVIVDAFQWGGHPYEQARQIRAAIGLTTNQEAMVGNFRRLLQNRDTAALARQLRDRRYDRTVLAAIRENRNLTDDQISTMVARYRQRFINLRAETISRSESMRAANAGQNAAWAQAVGNGYLNPNTVRRFWLVTPDDRLCDYCDAVPDLNEKGVGLDQPFETELGAVLFPPLHPNCFPGDTLVAARSRVTGYSRRWFDGNLAVIRTATGKEFSVTVNHPILTSGGWVGAGALKEGDNLIGGAFSNGFGFGNAHDENAPSTIHEIAESLGRSSEVTSRPVPVSAEHFHGDGEGSKIAIIGSDSLLWRYAADAVMARELIDGCAGQIAVDKVVFVGRRPFSGHVYNLETEGGWYVANGIVAHNCRCITYISQT